MRRILTLSMIVLWAGCSPGGDPEPLRLHLEPGATRSVRISMEEDFHQKSAAGEMRSKQTFVMELDYSVESVNESGEMTTVQVVRALQVTTNSEDGSVSYDSRNAENVPPQAVGFHAVVGAPVTLRVTPAGRVVAIDGVDAIWEKARTDAHLPPGAQGAQMFETFKSTFGDRMFRGTPEMLTAVFPPEPVSPGDAWKCRTHQAVYMVDLDTRWKLGSRNAEETVLTGTVEALPVERAEETKFGLVNVFYALKGSGKGEARLDPASGWMRTGSYELELSGTVRFSGRTAATTQHDVRIQQKTTIEPL